MPSRARQFQDKGMIIMDNRHELVHVPLIGLISDLEHFKFSELYEEIKGANPGISKSTAAGVLEGVLKHVYYDPVQSVREDRLKEVFRPLP